MRNREEIKELLDYFRTQENKELKFDEEAIFTAYEKRDDHQSLAVKILSVFGGILASLAFLGFLFITGIYDSTSGLLISGILLMTGGMFINRMYRTIIFDTVSVSSYLIGLVLFALGLFKMEMTENTVSLICILIAAGSLVVVRSYIIAFISVLIITGGSITLIVSNHNYDLMHLYISLLAIMVTAVFLKEAKIISLHPAISKLYDPVRIGLIFSFLAGLVFLGNDFIEVSRDYIWVSSVVIILNIMFVLSRLFEVLSISQTTQKTGIYIVTMALLLPTLLSPAISGAILIILVSFLVNYKTSLAIGMMAFIYFVSRYYYDLHFTLLTKSILLFSSGILFLGLYLLTRKKLTSNEKI